MAASAPPGFTPNGPVSTPSETSPTPTPMAPKKKAKKPKAEDAEEEEIDESQVGVGSIAAGGRYDNLVGSFTSAAAGEGKKGAQCPCIGVSIGLDRIFALVWPKWIEKGMRSKETMAYVIAVGDGLLAERIRLVQELREAGIKVRGGELISVSRVTDVDVRFFCVSFRRISWQSGNQNCRCSLRRRKRTRCRLIFYWAVTS